MIKKTVYIKMKHHLSVDISETIFLKDIALVRGDPSFREKMESVILWEVSSEDRPFFIIDLIHIIDKVNHCISEVTIQAIGRTETILYVDKKKKKRVHHIVLFAFVWLLLFFGSGLAMMYFHEDVGMDKVHQRLYYMITGEEKDRPLLLQIPYSLGLGAGMILFFNQLFKKKFNDEPSPLDIELSKYEREIEQYVTLHEKGENE